MACIKAPAQARACWRTYYNNALCTIIGVRVSWVCSHVSFPLQSCSPVHLRHTHRGHFAWWSPTIVLCKSIPENWCHPHVVSHQSLSLLTADHASLLINVCPDFALAWLPITLVVHGQWTTSACAWSSFCPISATTVGLLCPARPSAARRENANLPNYLFQLHDFVTACCARAMDEADAYAYVPCAIQQVVLS